MVTFMRIVLFLMLKAGLTCGSTTTASGANVSAWESLLTIPASLAIEGDHDAIEEAVTICSLYNPAEISKESIISNNEPLLMCRASLRFDTVKPGLEKQISERLLQQFAGRIRFIWTHTL